MMSYRYRLKPEILRFYPIPPFSFPLTSLPAKIKKWIEMFSVGLDHLDGLCKLMEELSQLKDQNLHLQKRLTFLEVTPYYKHVFRKKNPPPPTLHVHNPCLYLLYSLYLVYSPFPLSISPMSPISSISPISYISYNLLYLLYLQYYISHFLFLCISYTSYNFFIFYISFISYILNISHNSHISSICHIFYIYYISFSISTLSR